MYIINVLQKLDTKLNQLDDKLDQKMNELGNKINQLEDKLDQLDNKVNNITENIDKHRKEKKDKGWLTEVVCSFNKYQIISNHL